MKSAQRWAATRTYVEGLGGLNGPRLAVFRACCDEIAPYLSEDLGDVVKIKMVQLPWRGHGGQTGRELQLH
jgi:hypothetical protein